MNDCKRRKENVSFSNARVAKLGLLISLKRRWVDLHSPSFTALPSVDQVLIPRLVYRHTTLQIVSTSHNQLWDRIYFFGQFGFGRVLKSTKNQTTTHTTHEQAKEQREEKSSSNSKKSPNISLRSYLKPSQIRYTGLIL